MFPELLPNWVVGKDAQQLVNIYVYASYLYIVLFFLGMVYNRGGGGSFVVTAFLK